MAQKQNDPTEELRTKKQNRKGIIVFVLIIAVMAPTIWFGLEWLATEYVLSKTPVEQNGKQLIVQFSEKTRGHSTRDPQSKVSEQGVSHYGYTLELIDSLTKKSLHKIKFKSPFWNIAVTPQMVVDSNKVIWIVSTTARYDYDDMGYLLKFTINNSQIKQEDFKLLGNYCIREIEDHKVFVSKEMDMYHGHNAIMTYTYFDLNTGKIVEKKGVM